METEPLVPDGPKPLTVVVIGLGQMGRSHTLAYHNIPDFKIIGFVNRSPVSLEPPLDNYPFLDSFDEALKLKPDVVSICTHSDSHASYTIRALEAGSHVFVEKPLATSLEDAEEVVATAKRVNRKVVVGYILRHHPSWIQSIERARQLGPPFVMRMNLNQRSRGPAWDIHKKLLKSTSPIVDCGVHYIDVMLQITLSAPKRVHSMGVRLSDEIDEQQINYGHLQIVFEDGSCGWYEAGWGPMMSETAYFVKDVIGPRGAVSMIGREDVKSSDVGGHTSSSVLRLQDAATGATEDLVMEDEPDHNALCRREQEHLLDAIGEDRNLEGHLKDAVKSLEIVLAADRSMREERAIDL